jgi:hypothetical protein
LGQGRRHIGLGFHHALMQLTVFEHTGDLKDGLFTEVWAFSGNHTTKESIGMGIRKTRPILGAKAKLESLVRRHFNPNQDRGESDLPQDFRNSVALLAQRLSTQLCVHQSLNGLGCFNYDRSKAPARAQSL